MDNILCGSDEEVCVPEMGIGQWIFQTFQNLPPEFTILIEAATGNSITVGELLQKSISLVRSLEEMGVQVGDRLAIIGENTINLSICGFATWFLGAVMCPIDPTLKSREFQHMLNILQPKVIFCDKNLLDEVQDAATKLALEAIFIGVDTQDEEEILHLDNLLGRDVDDDFTPCSIENIHEETVVIVWSSGTTGMPKGVDITHFALAFQMSMKMDWPSTLIHTSYLSWVSGILMFVGASVNGLTRILVKAADPLALLQAIDQYKPMMGFMSPSQVSAALFRPEVEEFDLSSIETLTIGGAPLVPSLVDRIKDMIPNCTLKQIYGCSEISGLATKSSGIDLFNLGKPIPQTQVKVVDVDSGDALGPDDEGEIQIKSPSLMKGYVDNPTATQNAVSEDGWYRTGDLGKYSSEGVLYITGRIKELLKVESHQISPEEIEIVIEGILGVVDCAVVGIPVDENNLPMAVVVRKEDANLSEEDIMQVVAENLSEFKQLRAGVQFVENIPRTSTGKVKRRELQSLAEELYSS